MIKYWFIKKDTFIMQMKIAGHSLYAQHKDDIVCSSVSTATIMTLNAIKICGLHSKITYELKEGFFFGKVLVFDKLLDKLLKNLEYTLNDLSQSYPRYVQVIN
ncbi:ribosomal-processing cysteine protease Prp [Candidatus Phytoplasma phoenicium]|uniref:Ribosomal processing cysteine protease Prp n=1 Tax=Candidatus Phytoplasma phoenicium TaxID=198422 RepID=A0A0L0MJL6_9MOLU|nr:ribosomal-processing cysteine protease Prp [Candidatus Phytoplasma phoenicium]KND62538.1 hypothetical protein, protein of unknown function (DUF464) [Candidatus Phytoplasma phoenicium]